VSVGLIKDLTSAWPGRDLGACQPRERPSCASVCAAWPFRRGSAGLGAVAGAAHSHGRRLPDF